MSTDINKIRAALGHVPSDERDMWIRMGAAIKSELGDAGFQAWNEWSKSSDRYNAKDARTQWKSLKTGRVQIGSLFYEARQRGYKPSEPYSPPSREELAARKAAQEEQRVKAKQERLAEMAEAKVMAQKRYNQASPLKDLNHPYLLNKLINDPAVTRQIRQEGNNLLIPLKKNGEIVGLQEITPDGSKYFTKGMDLKGASLVIGSWSKAKVDGLVLAEGYATAASIHKATGWPTIVCVTGENLAAVAERLPKDLTVIIAADNDPAVIKSDGETYRPGMKYAEKAAEVLGDKARIIEPYFSNTDINAFNGHPTDFNDLESLHGLDAVKQQFNLFLNLDTHMNNTPPHYTPKITAEQEAIDDFTAMKNHKITFYELSKKLENTEYKVAFEAQLSKQGQELHERGYAVDLKTYTQEEIESINNAAINAHPGAKEAFDAKYPDGYLKSPSFSQADNNQPQRTSAEQEAINDFTAMKNHKITFYELSKKLENTEYKVAFEAQLSKQGQELHERGYAVDLKTYTQEEIESINNAAINAHPGAKEAFDTKYPDGYLQSEAEKILTQNTAPSQAHIESSIKVDVDADVPMRNVGGAEIQSELKAFMHNLTPSQQGLDKSNLSKLQSYKSVALMMLSGLKQDDRQTAIRNFNDNMDKSINGTALHLPEPIKQTKEQDLHRSSDRTHETHEQSL